MPANIQISFRGSNRSLGGADRIIERLLARLHLGLGRCTDANYRHAAGQLCQPLLQQLLPRSAGDSGCTAHRCFSPAPLTTVLFSLVTTTRFADPSTSMVAFPSLTPTSSQIIRPPVSIARSLRSNSLAMVTPSLQMIGNPSSPGSAPTSVPRSRARHRRAASHPPGSSPGRRSGTGALVDVPRDALPLCFTCY
jgi:hypothetical protein